MDRTCLRRTFPPTPENVLNVLRAVQGRHGLGHIPDVERHFEGEDRKQVRKELVLALDRLVHLGHLEWVSPPSAVARARARDQIWDLLQEEHARIWREHALPGWQPQGGQLMLYRLWEDDAEGLAVDLEGGITDAPCRSLLFRFPHDREECHPVPGASTHLPEVDTDAVASAIDTISYEKGATFEELVAFFDIRGAHRWKVVEADGRVRDLRVPVVEEFHDLVSRGVKSNEFLLDKATERYRTNPDEPIGNAIRLYLELWPWGSQESWQAHGPAEAGSKARLGRTTVHEHFHDLCKARLLEKTPEGRSKYRPLGDHVLTRLAQIVASLEGERRQTCRGEPAPIAVQDVLERLCDERKGAPFHRLTDEARRSLMEGVVRNGVLEIPGWRRNAPDLALHVRLSVEARFTIHACETCGDPILADDLVELREAGEGQAWRWASIRHASCPARRRGWAAAPLLSPDAWSASKRHHLACVTCGESLRRVTAADLLRACPNGGHASLYAIRRLRAILPPSSKRTTDHPPPRDGHAILRALEEPSLPWRQRETLLVHLLDYLERTDLSPPAERAAWLDVVADFESRHHRNDTQLFHVVSLAREDHHLEWSLRRSMGDGPAYGVIDRWGYRHASCPPRQDLEDDRQAPGLTAR